MLTVLKPETKLGIWAFPKIGVPQNGWFIMENPIKMDDLGIALFLETPICFGGSTKRDALNQHVERSTDCKHVCKKYNYKTLTNMLLIIQYRLQYHPKSTIQKSGPSMPV